MAFVYGLRAVDEPECFYIGSTKRSLAHRFNQHLEAIRNGRNTNTHFVRKAKKVGLGNILIETIEECAESDRFDREYIAIHEALKRGVRLTNAIVSKRDFERVRPFREYEDFLLTPAHLLKMVEAAEFGIPRTGNGGHDILADFLEGTSRYLVLERTAEFHELVREVMDAHYEGDEADQQAAGIRQRVSGLLERQ